MSKEQELLDELEYLYANANQWIINKAERKGEESAYTFLESDEAHNMLLRLIKEFSDSNRLEDISCKEWSDE